MASRFLKVLRAIIIPTLLLSSIEVGAEDHPSAQDIPLCETCVRLHYEVAGLDGDPNGGLKIVVDGQVIHTDSEPADHYHARWVDIPLLNLSSGDFQFRVESVRGVEIYDVFFLRNVRIVGPDGWVVHDPRHSLTDNLYVGGGDPAGTTTKWPLYLPSREFRFDLPQFVQNDGQAVRKVIPLGEGRVDALPPRRLKQDLTDAYTGGNGFVVERFQVPASGSASHIDVQWEGRGNDGAALWFWNANSDAWQLLDDTSEESVLSGVVSLSQASVDGNIELMVSNAIHRPKPSNLVLAWISDTQFQTMATMRDLDVVGKQARWLAANVQRLGVDYLVTTGDGTQSYGLQEEEFRYLSKAWAVFDQVGLPWGVVPGNHDYVNGRRIAQKKENIGDECDPRLVFYCRYFGANRFRHRPWYGESYRDNENHFDVIEHGGQKLLILYLGWSYDSDELQWAANVLARHPGVPTILATHETIGTVANFGVKGMQALPGNQQLFSALVDRFPQIVLTMGGHFHGAAYRVTRLYKLPRLDLVHDYQFAPQTGGGWLHFLYIDMERQILSSRPYSPMVNAHMHPGYVWKHGTREFPFSGEYTYFTLPFGLQPVNRWLKTDRITAAAVSLH